MFVPLPNKTFLLLVRDPDAFLGQMRYIIPPAEFWVFPRGLLLVGCEGKPWKGEALRRQGHIQCKTFMMVWQNSHCGRMWCRRQWWNRDAADLLICRLFSRLIILSLNVETILETLITVSQRLNSRLQRLFLYRHEWQRKAAYPHMKVCSTFLLEKKRLKWFINYRKKKSLQLIFLWSAAQLIVAARAHISPRTKIRVCQEESPSGPSEESKYSSLFQCNQLRCSCTQSDPS